MPIKQPNVIEQERYSVKETCYHLGICRDTLSKYTSAGKIPRYTHISGRQFYLGKDILAFFEELDVAGSVIVNRGRKSKQR